MDQAKACQEPQEPEFRKLLTALNYEASVATELTNQVYYLSNNIQRIPEAEQKIEPIDKEPTGVIETLWREVYRLRSSNADLQRVMDHLQKVVGH